MNRNLRTALIIGGVVLVALIAVSLLGGGQGWQGGSWSGIMRSGMMGGLGGGSWMAIIMVLISVLVIWAIVALARGDGWRGERDRSVSDDSALEVLRRRCTRGEISKEELEEKTRALA